jgi:ubiquinol-cytochrome c reductase cytochrome b subunit
VFALAVGAVVVALAIFLGPKELAAQADPTNVNAYPRPDWYFLSYFALLSLIPPSIEDWVIIGFPLLVGILLFAVPFISNKGERSPTRRPWTFAIVGVVAVSLVVLVRVGDEAPWSPNLNPGPLPVAVTQNLNPAQAHGADLFHSSGCVNCHLVDGVGGKRGPNLTHVADRLDRDQMIWRILNGGTNMPAYGRSMPPDDLSDLVDFLQTLK